MRLIHRLYWMVCAFYGTGLSPGSIREKIGCPHFQLICASKFIKNKLDIYLLFSVIYRVTFIFHQPYWFWIFGDTNMYLWRRFMNRCLLFLNPLWIIHHLSVFLFTCMSSALVRLMVSKELIDWWLWFFKIENIYRFFSPKLFLCLNWNDHMVPYSMVV